MASSSSSSTNSTGWKYDVFLNFRGTDTRNNFTSHLKSVLRRRGIRTFIDDQIERGKFISPALLETIESSRISILIFSPNYASSTYCLDELVKILECQKSKGQIVVPIFYNVKPEVVEKQSESYGEAFTTLESEEGVEKVKVWRAALTTATSFAGWPLNDRDEADFIRCIVEDVRKKLNKKVLHVADYPVGIDYHTEIMSHKLSVGLHDVRMVGICGIGGIGKTTIAKATFNEFADQFEGSCFLASVRESSKRYSIAQLQETLLFEILGDKEVLSENSDRGIILLKEMLCSKKVFIVIDDVEDIGQLKKLAGGLDWFGSGSRIIITTRDKHLLASHGVQTVHKVEGLHHWNAIRLFSWNAFKKDQPEENFAELSLRVLKYVNHLPLALVVLGSHLYGMNITEWKSCLAKWERNPDKKIFDVLKISFDALDYNEKAIFLDIACFFKWKDVDDVSKILEACDFKAPSGIKRLIEKSLICIEYGKLQMHDLIQSMGWQIVFQESPKNPGKRSRLWFHQDVIDVLTEDVGTQKIEAIMVDLPKGEEDIYVHRKAFSKMKRLRILIIRNARITGCPKSLPNELRWLDWPQCPLETLPSTFQPRKLVSLNMPNSLFKHLAFGFKNFEGLKDMNFSYCESLTEIPDLSNVRNLERMDFEGCTSLTRIDQSLGSLEKLETLSFRFCSNLGSIPSCFKLRSLQRLYLTGCAKLEEFPNTMKYMACLEELFLDGTAIKELPSSIEFLLKLRRLDLSGCKNLCSLPSSIYNLNYLWELHLDNCLHLTKFSENTANQYRRLFWNYSFGIRYCNPSDLLKGLDFSWLRFLDLSGNNLASIPSCIRWFNRLREIYLRQCPRLREIPELPISTEKVVASDCSSLERFSGWTHMSQLKHFEFDNCHKLSVDYCSEPSKFSEDPVSRDPWLYRDGIFKMRYCNLSNLEFLNGIEFSWLTHLDISGNSFASLPSCISKFTHLNEIYLCECPGLREIPELPRTVFKVVANDCKSLERFSLCHRSRYSFFNCHKWAGNQDNFENLASYLDNRSSLAADTSSLVKLFHVVLPGGEILPWFHHKSEGDFLSFQLPSSVDFGKIKAVLFCIIIASGASATILDVTCDISINGNSYLSPMEFNLAQAFTFESDHMWFGNVYNFLHGLNEFDLYGASVKIQCSVANGTVKKCGAHVVFKEYGHSKATDAVIREVFDFDQNLSKLEFMDYLYFKKDDDPSEPNDDVGSESDELVFSDNDHSERNGEPGSGKNEFGMPLALLLPPSVLLSQDPSGIQELEDRLHDSLKAMKDTQGKSLGRTDELPNVPVTQDLLDIEELEYTHSEDSELHGQPQRKRMRLTDEHALTFSDNENKFQLSLALSLQTTVLRTQDSGANDDVGSKSNELVSSDNDHSEWNDEPGSRENEFRMPLALSLRPSVLLSQDLSGIQELEDRRHDSLKAMKDTQGKSLGRIDELPNVPVTQDLLDIEELEDTHNKDSELHGQPQRKRMRLTDEHAMTFSNNENEF